MHLRYRVRMTNFFEFLALHMYSNVWQLHFFVFIYIPRSENQTKQLRVPARFTYSPSTLTWKHTEQYTVHYTSTIPLILALPVINLR
jgi:hypothetical protein